MSTAIRLDHVTKRFGSQLALNDVSLEVAPGTVFALLGENGAGKSTTIRLLLGLVEPDSGHASVFGMESVTHSQEIRRCVGYVAERPTLYDWMTVDEIGWFTAGFYGGSFQTTYNELVQRFTLPRNKKLKTLSKGMRAKVALALSMGHDPDLLILDEPTSGLDTMVRRDFLESMVDRAALGKTVFLSSHQIHEVERVADIVGIMRSGQLIVVERLEKLKAEVQELTVTFSDSSGVPPLVAGELLRQQRRSRQWQLLVRNGERESIQQLSDYESVQNIEIRTPSLEEIFVAYMRHEGGESQNTDRQPVEA